MRQKLCFRLFSGLTSIEIPQSVTRIGMKAFYDCRGLNSVHISDIAAWCANRFGFNLVLYYAYNLYLNGIL
ncbi:MAG: leucine-rich repeat protein [Paludibacteraceae bacterium]|nr:leucine-rich repeat protein [Paludibacteraceae bacterium]MBQ9705820.1 leucine-rich repeat protein [Paludibacteraceae bacterium]MBR1466305.1 leucine-rich repeat protein [Bacteroidaceae bacterium]